MANQIGINAVWNNTGFTAGIGQYIQQLLHAQQQTTGTAGAQATVGKSSTVMQGGLTGVANAAGSAATGLIGVVAAGVAVGTAIVGAAKAVIDFTKDLISMGNEALMAASRVQQLSYIAQTVGQFAGYSSEQMMGFVDSIRQQGISMEVANKLAIQFARYQLDMATATDVARVAQDAATIAGIGSSEALDRILHGITTLNIRVLRTAGIMVDSETAYKTYAAEVGKTVEQLSEQERVQAFVNAVIAAGIPIQGAYQASMETASKQLGTLKSRLLPDLLATLGAPFQTAFYNAVTAINSLVKAFTASLQEGGALYPIMVNLGAVFAILTGGVKDAANTVSEFGNTFLAGLIDKIASGIKTLFDWGMNISISLAKGLIQGAATAITAAMNYISKILTWWLSPGSPPNVAPDIDTWGTATMAEYLRGFSEADFGLLKDLQKPLEDALSTLVDLGKLDKGAAKDIFVDLSQQMIAAIESGTATEEMFQNLAAATGEYGMEIAELARRQFALSGAIDAVSAAEAELEAARKRQEDTGLEVNKLTLEYNALLRSGADATTLAAKKAEIDAAAIAAETAAGETVAAEDKLTLAEENLKILQEQAAVQEELVNMLLDMAKAAMPETGGAGGGPTMPEIGGAGGAGGGLGEEGWTLPEPGEGFDPESILDPMKTAVAEAKQNIIDTFTGIWTNIQTTWATEVAPLFQPVIDKWNEIKPTILEVWEKIKTGLSEAWQWIQDEAGKFVEMLRGWWEKHGESVRTVWNVIKNVIGGILLVIWTIIKTVFLSIFQTIKKVWEPLKTYFAAAWNFIKTIFSIALDQIGVVFDIFAALFKGDWEGVWQGIKDFVGNIGKAITATIQFFLTWIKTMWLVFTTFLKTLWENIWKIIGSTVTKAVTAIGNWFKNAWTNIKNFFVNIWTGIVTFIQSVLAGIGAWFRNAWTNITTTIRNVWNGIVLFFQNIWTTIQTKIVEVWEGIKAWLLGLLRGLFEGMGLDFDAFVLRWQEIWDRIVAIIVAIWEAIKLKIEELILFFTEKFTAIKEFFAGVWDEISAKVTEIWDAVYIFVTEKIEAIRTWVEEKIAAIRDFMGEVWDTISGKVTEIWEAIYTFVTEKIEAVRTWIEEKIAAIRDTMAGIWDEISTKVTEIWQSIWDGITGKIAEITESVTTWINGILTTLGGYVDSFFTMGKDLLGGLVDGILSAVGDVIDAITGAVEDAISWAENLLGIGSHSKLFKWIGRMTMGGLGEGITASSIEPARAMTGAMIRTMAPAAAVPIMTGNASRNLTVNLGGQNIYSGMDAAGFEYTIRRIIRAELGAT